ncbi:MAG: serine/threonine-protein kinase [Acidobacteriota bacterium]|nr:serine/threonine-protein kinase [Acidobacteriota bacterium]
MKTRFQPGEQLDHFLIHEVVSTGATAVILRATDLRTQRTVGIKIPRFEVESEPLLAERFHREEEIGKTLHHPGIIKVYPETERSQLYLVTEWFEGAPLRELLQKGPLAKERAVRIAIGVCNILGYLHDHGIVHRDLTPDHILVGAEDVLRLTGFGVASMNGARRITFSSLSQMIGLTTYLSPEELSGKRGDARSDLYAVGVILYEMLTAKLPFRELNPYEARLYPVPPREADPSITPQLQEVIFRALEPEPRHRYGTAHELARGLAHLDEVKIEERPELFGRDTLKERPKGKRALLIALVALVPIILFILLLVVARS